MPLDPEKLREHRARMVESQAQMIQSLRQAEEAAGTPVEAARYRGMRRALERGQGHRVKAEGGLLPCPHCAEWGDLAPGYCPECGVPVEWQEVIWRTGTWQVYLSFFLLFGGGTAILLWLIASPDARPGWQLGAALLLIPVGWLAYLNALRMGRLLAWKLRRRGH